MKKYVIILLWFYFPALNVHSQNAEKIIQSGNELYKKQNYDDAAKEYRKVLQTDSLGNIAKFNLGNTLYKNGAKPEAINTYSDLINDPRNTEMIADLYYNKGVILSSQNKLEESITAYENALLKNPDDKETRENLQKALLQLKKLNESKNQNNKKKQQKKQQPPPSAMNQKEAEKKLKELEQKEKEIQQRMQRTTPGNSSQKDW